MRKIGINLHASKGLSDEQYAEKMAQVGFDAVFTGMFDIERHKSLSELFRKNGIFYETIHAPYNKINTMWSHDKDGDETLKTYKLCADCCCEAQVPIMIMHLSSGINPPDFSNAGIERFHSLAEYCHTRGITLAFENQRKIANLAWSLETFDKEYAGFCWDCGHEACFTPGIEFMPLFGKRLICTHIHDNRGIYNCDDHVLPFDGKIDYERVACYIRESGFDGSLMLEIESNEPPCDFLERAADVAKKLRFMVDGE